MGMCLCTCKPNIKREYQLDWCLQVLVRVHHLFTIQDGSLSVHDKSQPLSSDVSHLCGMSRDPLTSTSKQVLPVSQQEALALHFDWLEGLQAQIKEVQGITNYNHSC